MIIRSYTTTDYDQLKTLYLDSSTFGGQFDESRDAKDRLQKKIESDPDAILVAINNDRLVGTLSLIDDGRVAWLFRFAVLSGHQDATTLLHDKAIELLKKHGHSQVLVYSPTGDDDLDTRYQSLGFTRGSAYTCFWKAI